MAKITIDQIEQINSDSILEGSTNLFFTSSEKTKLSGIESNATADQTGAEIVSSINTELGSTDWQSGGGGGGNVSNTGTPVNNQLAIWTNSTTIEGSSSLTYDGTDLSLSDGKFTVTQTGTPAVFIANRTDGVATSLVAGGGGSNFRFDSSGSFQIQSQAKSDIVAGNGTGLTTLFALDSSGNVTLSGTVDGRDVATDGSKLDGIEAGADVTDETNVTNALDGATLTDVGTPAATDLILLQDASDSNNLKTAQFSQFGGGGGGGSTNSYLVPIWAEENSTLGNGTYEWAFGNGANTPSNNGITIYVPTGYTAAIVAMTATTNNAGGSSVIEANINGVLQGSNCNVTLSGRSGVNDSFTPVAITSGDRLAFRTTTAGTNSSPNTVCAWIEYTET